MELNQFRNVDVVLDKANDNIIQKQFVSAGDKDGRSLTAQLTDNGVIGEIIGAALNLYWHNQASGLTDLSAFSVVDRATSVFKIDYPQNMLTPGKVMAYIQILHGGKVTHTKPFEITVQKLAGTTRGVLATAEYGALVTTLAKANEIETEIAEVTAQLAQKAERDSVFSMANMGQDIKTAITGNSVAVVGKGSVLTENIVSKQVTPITTNFFNLVDFMELHSINFTANEVGLDGVFSSISPTSRSLIFRVEPNSNYKLKFNGFIGDRGNVIGNNNNDFVVGQTYQTLAINARENDVITFSTTSTTTYVCVYFHSNGNTLEYYEANKAQLSLYKDRLPVNTYPTIKKNNLPTDILYKGEVEPRDTTFFTFYNLLEKNTPQFLNAHCDTDGKVTLDSNASSLVIEVEANTTYHLQLPLESNRAFVLSSEDVFDSGKIYSIIDVTVLPNKKYTFTTKQNTKRVFIYYHSTSVNFDKSSIELVVNINDFGKGTLLKSRFSAALPPYVGKKIMTMGDSITAIPTDVRGWQKYFNEIIKPSNFDNVAVSGATWCDKLGTVYDGNPVINGIDNNVNNTIGNQVQKIIQGDYAEPDIIIISAGTNDTEQDMTAEEISQEFYKNGAIVPLENTNKLNFAGAIRYSVETLRSIYPNTQIFITTPLQRAEPSYNAIRLKGETIKNVAHRLSVPVIDAQECGVYGLNAITGTETLYHSDGLHLSAKGAEKLGVYNARKIANWYSF